MNLNQSEFESEFFNLGVSSVQLCKKAEEEDKLFFRNYKPYDKQRLFHSLGYAAQERLLLGGNRSGKTYSGSTEVCMHVTGIYPEDWNGYKYVYAPNVWVVGVSNKEVKATLLKMYIEGSGLNDPLIAPHLIVSQNKVDHVYKIR